MAIILFTVLLELTDGGRNGRILILRDHWLQVPTCRRQPVHSRADRDVRGPGVRLGGRRAGRERSRDVLQMICEECLLNTFD